MSRMSRDELLAALREIDTSTITNVVATYPTNPLCLGLYNPWTEKWYTDTSIRCIYPEMVERHRLQRGGPVLASRPSSRGGGRITLRVDPQ